MPTVAERLIPHGQRLVNGPGNTELDNWRKSTSNTFVCHAMPHETPIHGFPNCVLWCLVYMTQGGAPIPEAICGRHVAACRTAIRSWRHPILNALPKGAERAATVNSNTIGICVWPPRHIETPLA